MIINSNITPPTSQGGLPSGYTLVDYIESDGTQWIDTEYIPNSTDFVEMDLYFSSSNQTGGHCPFGCRGNYSNWVYEESLCCSFNIDSNNRIHSYRYSSESYVSYNGLLDKKIRISSCMQSFSVMSIESANGKISNFSKTPLQPVQPLYLFCTNQKNNGADYFCKMKLYSCIIGNSIGLINHLYLPVVRDSDNKPGLYDLMANKFLINKGNGNDFIIPTT